MKTAFSSLILLAILALNAIAQDSTQWGLPDGAKARLTFGGGRIYDIEYSPDGTRLAVASSSGVWIYDSVTVAPITPIGTLAFDIAFSPDGRTLASGSGILHLWDVVTGKKKDILHKGDRSASRVAFSADGRMIAAGNEHRIYIWDAVTGEQKYAWGEWHPNRYFKGWELGEVRSLAFSPDGRTLASGHESFHVGHSEGKGKIHLWDALTGERKNTLTESGLATSLAFSPDGRTLASGHLNWWLGSGIWGWVTLRDVETSETKHVLRGHAGPVQSVALSADGRLLASGGGIDEDNIRERDTLRLWDAATGAHLRSMDRHAGRVYSLAFSPDGRTLASGNSDGTVLLWDLLPSPDPPQDEHPQVSEFSEVAPDVNENGVVDIQDLVLVAGRLGISAVNRADVNGDGFVNALDVALVAGMADDVTSTLPMYSNGAMMLRTTDVKQWLEQVWGLGIPERISLRAIQFLQNLLEALTPERTALLPNYPNPFNPETWIPYQLARDAGVQISIYNSKGILVRKLDLGLQPEGFYTDKHHAAYWDGRNEGGELLASGLYVYEFRAGSFRASRRMAFVR